MKLMVSAMLSVAAFLMPTTAAAQSDPTTRIPLCLQYPDVARKVPCTGVVPVDSVTGNPLRWQDLMSGGGNSSATDPTAGTSSTTAKPVQNADGTKIATAANQSTVIASLGSPTDAAATTANATASSLIAQSKQLVNRVNALITALGSPVQAGVSVSNVLQATPTNRGLVVGLTAVTIIPANAARKGMAFQNQSTTASCYINGQATATADVNSLVIGPGGYYEPDHYVPTTAISIICTAANVSVYAREW